MRLAFQMWENQRRYAEVVAKAERYAEEQAQARRARGWTDSDIAASRDALFNAYVDAAPGVHKADAHYFLRLRTVARAALEVETQAFAKHGYEVERLGPGRAWDRAMRALVDGAAERLGQVAPELEDPTALVMQLLSERQARSWAHANAALRGGAPIPEDQVEAVTAAARAFDEAVGNDGLTREFADIAWAQACYAERRPTIRAGGVEVYVYKHPILRTRQIMARHADGYEATLVDAHKPNIVFPRVYPDGFWLEPTRGRYLAYSSQASGDESGAMLTVVDTRTADVVTTVKGADYPDVAWTSPTTFIWVGGASQQHGVRQVDVENGTRTMLRGQYSESQDPHFFRAVVGSRHRMGGAQRPWVVVSKNRGPNNSPNELTAMDTEDPRRRTQLLTYADATLGRALVTADNRLIVVSWSREHPRGRIAEVPLDLDRRHIPSHEWHDLAAGDGYGVIREVVPVDRGPGRAPLLAISRTLHGAAEVQLFDPTTAARTTLPLEELGLPAVHAPDGTRERGVFGQITGMTASTGPDGAPVVEVEHSSVVSSPRTFRFPLTSRGVGPAEELPREKSIADIVVDGAKVTRHTFHAPDGTEVRGMLVEHANAPGIGPVMFTSYQNFFVDNNTSRLFNHVHSTHFAAGGRTWFNEGRGTGSEGWQHCLDGVRDNTFGAVMDVVAGLDVIVERGIAERSDILTSAQSAGTLVMLRAVAQRPENVASATWRMNFHDALEGLAAASEISAEHESSVAGLMSSSYYLAGTAGPKLNVVVGAPDDRRVPDKSAQKLTGLLLTTTDETLLHVTDPGNGHFADEQAAAQELAAITRKCGFPAPSQTRPHILEDIRSIRPSLYAGDRGRDLLPPRARLRATQDRTQDRTRDQAGEPAATATPKQPAASVAVQAVNPAASRGFRSAADFIGHHKSTTGLSELALVNNRAQPLQFASGAPSAPEPALKYPAVRMELEPGVNRLCF